MSTASTTVSNKLANLLKQDFVKFCIVGALGFLINLTLLRWLLHVVGLPVYFAQPLSGEVAYLSNFFFHHIWTYRGRSNKDLPRLLVEFHAASWSGMLLTAVIVSTLIGVFRVSDTLSLAAASAVVLFWNYFWTKFFIWRHAEQSASAAPVVVETAPEATVS